MGHEGPGESEHARIPFERALRQLGQAAIEPARQILADLANLLLREIKVVEQPLVRGRDGALIANGLFDAAIGLEERPGRCPRVVWRAVGRRAGRAVTR